MIAYSMSERTFSTQDGFVRISITDPVKAVAGVSGGEQAQEGDLFGTDDLRAPIAGKLPTAIVGLSVEVDPLFMSASYKRVLLIQGNPLKLKGQVCEAEVGCGGLGLGPYVGATVDGELGLQPIARPGDVIHDSGWILNVGKVFSGKGKISTSPSGSIDGAGGSFGYGWGVHGGYQGCQIEVSSCSGNL